jgi:hypothetical protein
VEGRRIRSDGDDVPALGLEMEQLPGVDGELLPALLWVGLLPAEMP